MKDLIIHIGFISESILLLSSKSSLRTTVSKMATSYPHINIPLQTSILIPQSFLVAFFFCVLKVKPGLSSFAKNPTDAGKL